MNRLAIHNIGFINGELSLFKILISTNNQERKKNMIILIDAQKLRTEGN